MCGSHPKPAPPPAVPPVNPPPVPNILQSAEGVKRSDSSALTALRGRNSLRIDRAVGTLGGGGGNGLNIPN